MWHNTYITKDINIVFHGVAQYLLEFVLYMCKPMSRDGQGWAKGISSVYHFALPTMHTRLTSSVPN